MKNIKEKITYSAHDLVDYLGISRVGAYKLMESKGFPSFRIGKRILVTRSAFEKWLEEKEKKDS